MSKTNSTNTDNTNEYYGCTSTAAQGDSIKIGGSPNTLIGCNGLPNLSIFKEPTKRPHYDNKNGSLYKIANDLGLNAYEFDILKRIARCRKKGQFEQDLQKIKDTVDLYLKEHKQ